MISVVHPRSRLNKGTNRPRPHYHSINTMTRAIVAALVLCSEVLGLRLSMSLRKPMIAGNWKMNTDLTSAVALASDLGIYLTI